jgi:hypothetical protein
MHAGYRVWKVKSSEKSYFAVLGKSVRSFSEANSTAFHAPT